VELVEQTGGRLGGIALWEQYALLGVGPRVIVLDISDAARPRAIGRTSILPSLVVAVAVQRGIGYAVAGGTLYTIDVSRADRPSFLGSSAVLIQQPALDAQDRSTWPQRVGLVIAGDRAYMADAGRYTPAGTRVGGGLAIVDVSNPAGPQALAVHETYRSLALAVADQHVLVNGPEFQLMILDVSNPTSVREVGSIAGMSTAVAVQDRRAYVPVAGDGLRILDMSDPSRPTTLGTASAPVGVATDVVVVGRTVYVGYPSGFQSFDIADPSRAAALSFLPITDWYRGTVAGFEGMAVQGTRAFLLDPNLGVRVMDTSTPSAPTEIGSYVPVGEVEAIVTSGSNAFVGSLWQGVRVLNLATPSAVAVLALAEPPTLREADPRPTYMAQYLAVARDRLYAATSHSRLAVLDVTAPANLRFLGYAGDVVGAWSEVAGIVVGGSRLAIFGSQGARGVVLFTDLSVPDPLPLAVPGAPPPLPPSRFISASFPVSTLALQGDTAYVGLGLELQTWQLADTAATAMGSVTLPAPPRTVVVDGGDAYVAAGAPGQASMLVVVDVSNAANPNVLAALPLTGTPEGIALTRGHVAVALGYGGVAVIDVADHAAPRLVGEYTLPGRARGLLAAGDLLYVADQEGGLYVLRLTATPSSTR
jgi:hypothetical protein